MSEDNVLEMPAPPRRDYRKATVSFRVRALRCHGYLAEMPGRYRNLKLTRRGSLVLSQERAA